MAQPRVLAVDIGSSAVRSAVIDGAGEISASVRVTRVDGGDGTRFDAARLWDDVVESIVALPAAERSKITSIGIAGHVGTVLLDERGVPIGEGRGWADSSGTDLLTAAAEDSLPDLLRETGRVSVAGNAAGAFLALRTSDPVRARSVAHISTPKDYVIFRLTGRHVTDRTSAGYSGLSAVATGSWSRRMLGVIHLDPAHLPSQYAATDIIGRVVPAVSARLGVGDDVDVMAGSTDGSAGAALVLRNQRHVIADIAGTTDVLLRVVDHPALAPVGSVVNPYPLGGFSVGGPTGATGAALSRWSSILGFDSVASATEVLAAQVSRLGPGAEGLMIDPSLSGRRFPHWQADRTGTVVGQREQHGPEHVLLAAAEGAAHIVRDAADTLDPTGTGVVVLAGGAARSPALAQLRANVLGRVVEVCEEPDVSLLGAAYLALLGEAADVGDFTAGERRAIVRPDRKVSSQYAALHVEWRRALGFDD